MDIGIKYKINKYFKQHLFITIIIIDLFALFLLFTALSILTTNVLSELLLGVGSAFFGALITVSLVDKIIKKVMMNYGLKQEKLFY